MKHQQLRQRLDNWARWVLSRDSAGLGYPKAAPFARMSAGKVDGDSLYVSVVPVDSIDAGVVHDAVRNLQFAASHLYLALCCQYVGDPRAPSRRRRPLSLDETAQAMCLGPATIKGYRALALDALAAQLQSARHRADVRDGQQPVAAGVLR